MAETDRLNAEHFAAIEQRLSRIEAVLIRHSQLLEALPEAVREKIGFKPSPGKAD